MWIIHHKEQNFTHFYLGRVYDYCGSKTAVIMCKLSCRGRRYILSCILWILHFYLSQIWLESIHLADIAMHGVTTLFAWTLKQVESWVSVYKRSVLIGHLVTALSYLLIYASFFYEENQFFQLKCDIPHMVHCEQ